MTLFKTLAIAAVSLDSVGGDGGAKTAASTLAFINRWAAGFILDYPTVTDWIGGDWKTARHPIEPTEGGVEVVLQLHSDLARRREGDTRHFPNGEYYQFKYLQGTLISTAKESNDNQRVQERLRVKDMYPVFTYQFMPSNGEGTYKVQHVSTDEWLFYTKQPAKRSTTNAPLMVCAAVMVIVAIYAIRTCYGGPGGKRRAKNKNKKEVLNQEGSQYELSAKVNSGRRAQSTRASVYRPKRSMVSPPRTK